MEKEGEQSWGRVIVCGIIKKELAFIFSETRGESENEKVFKEIMAENFLI